MRNMVLQMTHIQALVFLLAANTGVIAVEKVCPGATVDVIMAIDTSGSIGEPDCVVCRQFMKDVFARLPLGNDMKTAALSFANTAKFMWALNESTSTDLTAINDEINNLPAAEGDTRISRALVNIRNQFRDNSRPDACKAVVMMTDGGSDKKVKTKPQADSLRAEGARICVVSVGERRQARKDEINDILQGDLAAPQGAEIESPELSDLAKPEVLQATLDCICSCVPPPTLPPITERPPFPPPSETSNCTCEVLGDPLADTCDGSIVALDASNLDQATQTGDIVLFEDDSVVVTVVIGFVDGVLLPQKVRVVFPMLSDDELAVFPDQTFTPPTNAGWPGTIDDAYVDGSFVGSKVILNSGLEILLGISQGVFVKLLTHIPSILQDLGGSGLCLTNQVEHYSPELEDWNGKGGFP